MFWRCRDGCWASLGKTGGIGNVCRSHEYCGSHCSASEPELALPSKRDGRTLTASDIRNLVDRVLPPGKHHPADPATRRKLQAIDSSSRFSPEALLIFQDLLARLGIATARPIGFLLTIFHSGTEQPIHLQATNQPQTFLHMRTS
jgi:hypothetical protein